ncbi:bifunctional 4-hydroxy-2-oxoglutarate aldolase/2-dehydro-3-deoxy-phosphogluconate aldolase [Catellatospora tritici]|uniref:bifunctional 4-hydroxy-2-oxoglutarate aldolase/2-dehydro-3-deoxy-phosphogluconate aldolase n=1 Tax=Catellatospora tritici TaxID=2851566 RepID=UPI001C2D2B95|nr:bifunctional 4-hydroxy-2-oxoglutarate aldolase/2-dehydro-3-deoxy-phosphogluconate aldolase [Catellatospora tritici]MBV1853098.1 bifunctional 4-hydroxy-2-oxoglutarate aldolase/2-dehydro-3-deoxy-phosphogluconate aldolase [Catellatospora tritici]
MESLVESLRHAKVVPVLRRADGAEAEAVARTLLDAGLPVVELTANTPDWAGVLGRLRASYPHAVLGVGTVCAPDVARAACDAGADFLVSPWPVPDVRAYADSRGVPLCEGGFTPGEIAAAARHGIAKLFPAHAVGPSYLKSVQAVLPAGSQVMPTGGIKLADVPAWLSAGAIAVGIGSDLDRLPQVWHELGTA